MKYVMWQYIGCSCIHTVPNVYGNLPHMSEGVSKVGAHVELCLLVSNALCQNLCNIEFKSFTFEEHLSSHLISAYLLGLHIVWYLG